MKQASENATSQKNPPRQPRVRNTQDLIFLIWDISIIVLVSLNLALILFDSLFAITPLAGALEWALPAFHSFYAENIHENFAEIDLWFVAVFILDVLAGWTVAVVQKRYDRWFIYPFAHWYDVLGCIPLSGFRFLRVLRLFTMGFRLQKLGVIDVRNWSLFQLLAKYYNVVMEEISDRVVINVLSGVQDEIRSGGNKLPQQVIREVVLPRKQQLVNTISAQLASTARSAHDDNQDEIRAYVGSVVARAVADNALAKGVERVPMLGSYLTQAIDDTITDTVCNVIEEGVDGLGSAEYEEMIQHIADSVFEVLVEDQPAASTELTQALVEVIGLVKEQVAVQRWKLPDEADPEAKAGG